MSKVDLIKNVKGIASFDNVVDRSFSELIPPTIAQATGQTISVEDFFSYYDQLFFDIPITGETNSHQYLVSRSTQYLGGSAIDTEKEALIEEINSLRQQILDLSQTYTTLGKI